MVSVKVLVLLSGLAVSCKGQQPADGTGNSSVIVYFKKPDTGYVGYVEDIPSISAVAAFKGLPYALPPLGDLRFKVFNVNVL